MLKELYGIIFVFILMALEELSGNKQNAKAILIYDLEQGEAPSHLGAGMRLAQQK